MKSPEGTSSTAWIPGISKQIDARALTRLDWLQRHYPDGPDCVGAMNQTFISLEQLVHDTVSASLASIDHHRTRQRLREVNLYASISIAITVFCFIISGGNFGRDARLVSIFGTVFAILASIHFAWEGHDERKKLAKQDSFRIAYSSLENTSVEVKKNRDDLSEQCIKALDNAPRKYERIDRSDFDEVLTYIGDELGDQRAIMPRDKTGATAKICNWLNGLLVLEDVYSELANDELKRETSTRRRDDLHSIFQRFMSNAGDNVVLRIPSTAANLTPKELTGQ